MPKSLKLLGVATPETMEHGFCVAAVDTKPNKLTAIETS